MLELYSITSPSESSAATQNTRMVVAYFISQKSSGNLRTINSSDRPTGRGRPTTGKPNHKLLVPPAGRAAGVPRLVAVGFSAAGALFAGSLSLSPTLMRSVVNPFRVLISFTDVPLAVAILSSVSPVFTRYEFSLLPTVAVATADADGAGTTSFWPTCSRVESTPGFAFVIAPAETPNFLPMVVKLSPRMTTYSRAVPGSAWST